MTKTYNTDDFVTLIAKKARFTKEDVKIILDAIVEIFEDCVQDSIVLKIRSLGKLYYSKVPARTISQFTDKFGQTHEEKSLPESRKVIFKLSRNIRYSGDYIPPSDALDKDDDMW